MTREEAGKLLNKWGVLLPSEAQDAVDMAIEALQREEAEAKGYCHRIKPKQDLLSRADAIKAVGEWMQKEYGYLDLNRAERLIDALSALPSARPDLISRTELFNKLATVQAPPEANEYKSEVYKIIQSMETEENDVK